MPQTHKQEPPAREIASARQTISDQDHQLASSAITQFKAEKYDTCLQQLKRLSELRQHDARVAANKAVVEYYVSKLCKTDEFMKQLGAAKKQVTAATRVFEMAKKVHCRRDIFDLSFRLQSVKLLFPNISLAQ